MCLIWYVVTHYIHILWANHKNVKLGMVVLVIALMVLLNFYMLNKVISNSGNDRNIEQTIRLNK